MTLLGATSLFTGCATAPVTYRVHAQADTRVPASPKVVIAPVDAELAELTAGGVLDLRDDWTTAAAKNLTEALQAQTGYAVMPAIEPAAVQGERIDVQALLRAITLNHLGRVVPGPAMFPAPVSSTLDYSTDPLPAFSGGLKADAVLFLFIRDSYATAGRKSLMALSVLGAALTGVAIIPNMGSTISSAALVDKDGTVLWFNYTLAPGDMRTPEGARTLVKSLLTGLPRGKGGA